MGAVRVRRRGWGAVVILALATMAVTCLMATTSTRKSAASQSLQSALLSFRRSPPYYAHDARSARLVELGRTLFFDPILSQSGTISCATCHNPGLSWGNGARRAIGDGGTVMALRSPTLLNIGELPRLGWDGKYPDIETVSLAAVTGGSNMKLSDLEAITRLGSNPQYRTLFGASFPGAGINRADLATALATYERTITSGQAPFDRFVAGDGGAIDDSAKRGFSLFTGRAGCAQCHATWAFTDGSFHDIGSATGVDIGRGRYFPTSRRLKYAFKTPTLRDVVRRGPYMHDGSVPDLAAVLDLYDRGGIDRPSRSELIHPLHLSQDDKADLIAFLATLTETPAHTTLPVLPR